MENLKKILGINLLILLIYTVLINLSFTGSERELGVALIMMMVVGIHVGINLLITIFLFIQKEKGLGKSFLLSTGVVLLVGFSSCVGSASI